MSRLATIALCAAVAISPAIYAQSSDIPTTPTTGANTTGTNTTGATTNGQSGNQSGATATQTGAGTPSPTAGTNATGTNTTGATIDGQNGPTAATSGSAAAAADRAMPDTAAGWLGMLFSGSMLSGAGLALRRLKK